MEVTGGFALSVTDPTGAGDVVEAEVGGEADRRPAGLTDLARVGDAEREVRRQAVTSIA